MSSLGEGIVRAVAPISVKIWPSLRNPVWRHAAAAELLLGQALLVSVDPKRVRRKLTAKAVLPFKNRFLVPDLGTLPSEPMQDLYTYMDMADIATHGENFAKTRLYQWLRASWLAGRPVTGRGTVFDSDATIEAYCRTYLDLYRSMQRDGYRYNGDDEICLGLGGAGEIVHIRRGTHRMAAAQILELPSVSARITHIDLSFAEAATRTAGFDVVGALGRAIQAATG